MGIPRKVVLLGATAAALALIPASTASAYNAAEKKAEKRQNDRIKKLSKDLSAAKNKVGEFDKSIAAQGASLTALDTRLKTIEGAAPAIFKGLTDLADAAGKLKTGLETAGAGLTTLSTAYQSVEYGVVRLYAGSTAVPGGTLVSSDIPDDGNTATVSASVPFVATGATQLSLRAAIRSNEGGDGEATGDPAGQVGGLIYAKCMPQPPSTNCAGAMIDSGAIACQSGPPPAQDFTTPAGVSSLNLRNIQEDDDRTDQTVPASDDTDVANGNCTIPAAGLWEVTVVGNFVDLPTSATPDAND